MSTNSSLGKRPADSDDSSDEDIPIDDGSSDDDDDDDDDRGTTAGIGKCMLQVQVVHVHTQCKMYCLILVHVAT